MSITSPDARISTYNPVVATTDFAANFPVFDNDDLAVFHNGVERTDFAVTATYVEGISNDAKAVFAVGITGKVDVVGARDPRRKNRFSNGGPLPIRDQNLALDTLEAESQEARRDIERAAKVAIGQVAPSISVGTDGQSLAFDADGNIIPGPVLPVDENSSYNPAVTGVVAPFISMRDKLRQSLTASDVKAAGDGVSDDQPEIMNVLSDLSTWGGGIFRLNSYRANTVFAIGASVAVPDNVYIVGDGDGATEVKALGDFPVFTNIGTQATNRNRGGIGNMTIRAGGMANANSHGVLLEWSNRFLLEKLRFHGCRDAINYHDAWQVYMNKLSVDGAGGDQNYRGMHATGHVTGNDNNAVIASDIIVQNVADVGFRLKYFNGSKFVNCEVAGSGSHGWHLGAPDADNGVVEWGHFSNILADTCGNDCFRIEKGIASDLKQIQINGLWCGTAQAGHGLNIFDASLMEITGLKTANTYKSGLALTRCSRMDIGTPNIDSYDRQNTTNPGILLIDTQRVGMSGGSVYVSDRPTSKAIQEVVSSGTTDNNRIDGVDVANGVTRVGASTIIKGCIGHRTKNSGSADVAVGTSSTTVTHGLAETPVNGDIHITPRFDPNAGGVSRYWVDNLTATTFRINVNTAVVTNTIAFSWVADCSRG